MKFEISQRDKKLLIILAIFVIVVGIGYWGVLPQLTRISEIEEEMETAEQLKYENELKIMELPMLEKDNEDLEKGIIDARAEFFPMMNSDEVDKYVTTMVLGYNLYAYDLSISMSNSETRLTPYINAKPKENDGSSASGETLSTGIYSVGISMKLGGTYQDFERIINDLSKTDKKIKLTSFSYGSTSRVVTAEDGSLEYQEEMILNLQLELFMCEE